MRLKVRPTPPKAYLDYKKLPEGLKKVAIKNDPSFWRTTEIKDYLDTMEALENERVSNVSHLQWLSTQVPDPEAVQIKINELMSDCYYVYGKGPQLHVRT